MPWQCSNEKCGATVPLDTVLVCPECHKAKSTWTIVEQRTRTMVLPASQQRIGCYRGEEGGELDAGQPELGVEWVATDRVTVLGGGQVRRLAEPGALPAGRDVLGVRMFPSKRQRKWKLKVAVQCTRRPVVTRTLEFVRDDAAPEGSCYMAWFLCVRGLEEPEQVAVQHVHLLDVTDDTPLGYAPMLEVTGLRKKPIPIQLEAPGITRGLIHGMFFEIDKAFLLPKAMPGIRRLKAFYDEHPGGEVLVVGHTDTSGGGAYNTQLSRERSEALGAYLTDDREGWTAWYSAPQASKRWGPREDQHMLSALPEGGQPFHPGPVTNNPSPQHTAAVTRFQEWSNQNRGTSLDVNGQSDGSTRRELVGAYMELDHTTFPEGTRLLTQGCGEHHPEEPTGDGVTSELNRRVELFFFPDSVEPPPPSGGCRSPGCSEYPEWRLKTIRTIDLSEELVTLQVRVREEGGDVLDQAEVRLVGLDNRSGFTDEQGFATFEDLDPGTYSTSAFKEGYRTRTVQIEVGGVPASTSTAPDTELGFVGAPGGGGVGGSGGVGSGGVGSGGVGSGGAGNGSDGGPDDGTGSGTTRADLELLAAPKIETFTIEAVTPPDLKPLGHMWELKKKQTPGPRALLHPGQRVTLRWTLSGDVNEIVVVGKKREYFFAPVKLEGAMADIDPIEFPPDAQGRYTLEALWFDEGSFYEPDRATTAEVLALGVTRFAIETTDFEDNPLYDRKLETPLERIESRPGRYRLLTEHEWWGQVAVRSPVRYRWTVAGADALRVELDVNYQRPKGFKEDVTDATREDPHGEGLHDLDDANLYNATFLEADLAVYEDAQGARGPRLASGTIRLRENRPMPTIDALRLRNIKTGALLSRGETVEDLEDIVVEWELGRQIVQTQLVLHAMEVVSSGHARYHYSPQLVKKSGDGTTIHSHRLRHGQPREVVGPTRGKVVLELRQHASQGEDVIQTETFEYRIATPPPKPKPPPPVAPQGSAQVYLSLRTPAILNPLPWGGTFGEDKVVFDVRIESNHPGYATDKVTLEIRKNVSSSANWKVVKNVSWGVGTHQIAWDGFDVRGMLDTAMLRGMLEARVFIHRKGWVDDVASLDLEGVRRKKPWIDFKHEWGTKSCDVTVHWDLRNDKGMDGAIFSRLTTRAEEAIARYWSRKISPYGVPFQVNTRAKQSASPAELFNVRISYDEEYQRSHNTGIIAGVMTYNRGSYKKVEDADTRWLYTVAHEYGHSILTGLRDRHYSWTHKGSTRELYQNTHTHSNEYPSWGEIDLMQYYKGEFYPQGFYERTIAVEHDVRGLITLSQIELEIR